MEDVLISSLLHALQTYSTQLHVCQDTLHSTEFAKPALPTVLHVVMLALGSVILVRKASLLSISLKIVLNATKPVENVLQLIQEYARNVHQVTTLM